MSPAAEALSTRNQKLAQKTFVYGKDGNRLKKNGQQTETYPASSPSKISIPRGSNEIQIKFRYSTIIVFHENVLFLLKSISQIATQGNESNQ